MSAQLNVTLGDQNSTVTSFISWNRLETHLRKSGELKKDETLDSVKVDDTGIHYCVGKTKETE